VIARLRRWWERVQLARACIRLRRNAAALGLDLSHVSDEQLLERAELAGRSLELARVTMAQAAEAFRQLGRAARAVEAAARQTDAILTDAVEKGGDR